MALLKEENLYWNIIQAYIKLAWVDIREDWEFENGNKKYIVNTTLDYYTNKTKEYHFKQEVETLKDLKEDELTLPIIYGKIMQLEKFNTATFI